MMAQDGLARSLRPVHAPFDGDVVFALSTGRNKQPRGIIREFTVARGVYEAALMPGMEGKAWRNL